LNINVILLPLVGACARSFHGRGKVVSVIKKIAVECQHDQAANHDKL